jgi:predicted flap endonuclease-1-like 5' DNA nuclease
MSKSIEAIEGIGPKYGAKLSGIGCGSPAKLLADGATRKNRKKIAQAAGISEAIVLRCVNMADLFRIRGVGTQYAELLEAAGVDTVRELRNRNAKNLYLALKQANNSRKRSHVRQLPNEKMVADWIAQAKALKPVVTY